MQNSPPRFHRSSIKISEEKPSNCVMNQIDLFETGSPKRSSREDYSPERTCPESPNVFPGIPSPPKKKKVSKSMELSILTQTLIFLGLLGTGSFGEVHRVCFSFESGVSPHIAVKIVKPGKVSTKALIAEAENLKGSPGCARGVAMRGEDGTYYGFSSIAIPLSNIKEIGAEMLEAVIEMTKAAIMASPIGVVFDCKPANLGFVKKGTPIVEVGADGQPYVSGYTLIDQVVFIDLGITWSPEEADKDFNPLIDDEDIQSPEAQLTFRKFKCKIMDALLCNHFVQNPRNEKEIVAEICSEFKYQYAAGQHMSF